MMKAFARSPEKRTGSSGCFITAVLRERAELAGQEKQSCPRSSDGNLIYIGGRYIKGPKDLRGITAIDAEIKTLQELEEANLPIPRVLHVGEDYVFFEMTEVPGERLGEDFSERLDDKELQQLALDIADFIISLAKAQPLNEGAFLINDDLNCDNVLVDPVTKKFSGVTDFGRMNYCKSGEWQPHHTLDGDLGRLIYAEVRRREHEIIGLPLVEGPRPYIKPARPAW